MPPINEQERNARRKSVASNLGTHEMEGIFADAPTLEIMRRYSEGELTLDQFSDEMDKHALSLVPAHTFAGAA